MPNFANPTQFLRLARVLVPITAALTLVLLASGFMLALFVAPPDYQQGETVRIMYLHVPAAWMAMFVYLVMSSAAIGTLVFRHPLADVAQKAAAPLGAGFTFLCLTTGSFWGEPEWGTWWVWDARLTSVLVLFLIYLGIIALWQVIEDPGRAARLVADLHARRCGQYSDHQVLRRLVAYAASAGLGVPHGRPTIAASMLWPLLVMALGFTTLFLTLHMLAIRNEILRRRLRRLSLLAADGAARLDIVPEPAE